MENSKKTVKEAIKFNGDLRSELSSYVDAYINWVAKEVPAGLERHFGVGVAATHRQFNDVWGFENGCGNYSCTGKGYYYAGDFNCWVNGSTASQMREFALRMPSLFQQGIKALESESLTIKKILDEKLDFENCVVEKA